MHLQVVALFLLITHAKITSLENSPTITTMFGTDHMPE